MSYFKGVDLQEGLDITEKLHCSNIWIKIEITVRRSPIVTVAKRADSSSSIPVAPAWSIGYLCNASFTSVS
jgi:hypothetical protein